MSNNLLKKDHFSKYINSVNINESYLIHDSISQNKKTVFISHKHNELDELRGFIGFLEKEYDVRCYIDSNDEYLPKKTNAETAKRIKEVIKKCDKFILIATDEAIESKWCNWELGFGDCNKNLENVVLLPLSNSSDNNYKGNEYLEMYSYIVLRKHGDKYKDNTYIEPGYYVRTKNIKGEYTITPLKYWLER